MKRSDYMLSELAIICLVVWLVALTVAAVAVLP